MKRIILPAAILFIFGCKEQTKTSKEKFTDTVVKDTTIVHDTVKLAAATPAVNAANDTITAGKSIGHISLNEKSADVIKELGKPDAEDAAMGKAMLTWFSKPSGKDADTVKNSIIVYTTTNFGGNDEAPRVKYIRITSPFFKTTEGISCGSTIAFIKMKYPALKKPTASYTDKNGATVMLYDVKDEGIGFEINEATKCVGITVHKPNTNPWEILVPEFGDIKKL